MTINVAQREAIDTVVNPIVLTIADGFPNTQDSKLVRSILWGLMLGNTDVVLADGTSPEEVYNNLNPGKKLEIRNFYRVFWGRIDLFANHHLGTEKPSMGEIRAAIMRSAISALNEYYPNDRHYPFLPVIDQNTQGMERIRALFLQYATLSMSGSIERHLLALEIIIEKEKLNIPSFMSSNDNIYGTESGSAYAPGDFSGLDLSRLNIERANGYGDGNFKGWSLKNSTFDGATFKNICFWATDFQQSSLRGVDLSSGNRETDGIVWNDADIAGMYLGDGYIPSRKAKNHALISKSKTELAQYRLEQGLTDNNNNNNNNNNNRPHTMFWSQKSAAPASAVAKVEASQTTAQSPEEQGPDSERNSRFTLL